jgi:hypothetical protein
MKSISKRLKKGPLEVQEYGRHQLQDMLSVGPYAYLQVPTPACSASSSDETSAQVMEWTRNAVRDCEPAIWQVCIIKCKLDALERILQKSTFVCKICAVVTPSS